MHHSIGELARRTGVKATTIRWYEAEGLLPPPGRSEGGHRQYDADHLRRLGFIRHARELGFAMPAIRALLGLAGKPREDCAAIHALATDQIAAIDSRLRRLQALRAELAEMAQSCQGGPAGDCRILETLADFGHGHCHHHEHGPAEPALPPG
jgi:Cu(I)-responsive transcriptional regulator